MHTAPLLLAGLATTGHGHKASRFTLMHTVSLLLSGLAITGHGHKVHVPLSTLQGGSHEDATVKKAHRHSMRISDLSHGIWSDSPNRAYDHVVGFAMLLLVLAGHPAGWCVNENAGSLNQPGRAVSHSHRPTPFDVRMAFDEKLYKMYEPPSSFDGTDLTIREYPNLILRSANAEITKFDDSLAQLCKEMFTVMYARGGSGLAAPQVGLNRQLFVYNPDDSILTRQLNERVVCNPRILEYGKETDVTVEGCLSTRRACCRGDVCRARELQVEYQDMKGNVRRERIEGFAARIFQHEYDHLQGVLHFDRYTPKDRQRVQPYLDMLIKDYGPGGAVDLSPDVRSGLQPPLTVSYDRISSEQLVGPFREAAEFATGCLGGVLGAAAIRKAAVASKMLDRS